MRRVLPLTIVLLLAVLARPAGAQAFSVGLRLDLPIAAGGVDVAIGDVNRDGNPDLVTINASANSVSVLLGDGKGGFGPKNDVPVGVVPTSLALGDFNGDGNPDLAVATSGAVRILLGNGAGGFGVATVLTTSLPAGEVRIADMTGDGRLDVIVVSVAAFQARIFPGNGAGGFGPRQDVNVEFNTSTCAIGDMNGDGRLDLCTMTPNLTMSVLLATGSGQYQGLLYPVTSGTSRIALGDLNGDGKPEVVTINGTTGIVSVYLVNGAGLLGPQIDSPATANVNRVSIADMNGDGRTDLALTTSTGSSLAVMLGNGTLSFAAPTFLTATPNDVRGLAVGDLNGDGRPDAVTVSNNAVATVLLNATGGEFRARTDWSVGATPRGVAMGDVNHDGRPDVAVANAGINAVSMLVASAAGGFQRQDFATQTAPVGVAIGDVNADGNADLMVTNSQSASVSRWLGTGLGDFFTRLDDPVGAGPVAVALADLKNGGTLDAVVVNNIASTVSVFPNIAGSLQPRTDYATGANPASLAIGDLNADGRPDIVVSNGSSNKASVFLGTGFAQFGAKTDFATGVTPLGIALGDVNGDGTPDLAVANAGAGTISILLGNGTGGFLPKVDFAVQAAPYAVALGDVNGDGRLDLSVAFLSVGSVSVFLGNGAGSFSPATNTVTDGGSEALTIGDLNGDGRLDLAVAVRVGGTGEVSVLLGRTPTKTTLSISAGPVVVGGIMMLTASVSVPAPGIGTPADSVRFFDGTTLLGTAPLGGGTAFLGLFAPYLGARSITAVYKGDGKFFGSISNVATPRVVTTAAPAITIIADVKGDQGGQARLTFARSAFDYLDSGTPISGYQVYRRSIVAGALTAAASDPASVQLAGWDQLTTLPATTEDVYQVVVPTLADSNGAGLHRAVLFVRALTATPGAHYDSLPDSGYSVDNLAPDAPSALTAVYAAGATHLHWVRNGEQDLASYRVYRGTSAGFIPGAENFLATVPDTGCADAGPPGSYYKVSAIDVNGNQSAFALVGPGATIDVPLAGAPAFALERVRPNPAPAMRLVVSFTLPTEAPAQLEVFDVRGARVGVQDVGSLGEGRHTVPLPSPRLAPGIYLVRLSQGVASMTQRITVVPR